MRKLTLPLLAGLLLGTAPHSEGTNVNDGIYQWQFLSGQPWPIGYQQNIGKPDNLIWARQEYSQDFFDRINNALPERELNEAFVSTDAQSTIALTEDAEVFVTFIHEGAGYRNSFGFFTFDAANPPQSKEDVDEIIVFPNLSYPHMTNGHRLSLGNFPAGTNIGFFIAANGYWFDTGVKPFAVPYYYSLPDLNPEQDEVLRQHTVLLYDEEVQEVIMGFEDLPRTWGDNDFNDAIFSVKSTPAQAIQSDTLIKVPAVNDSDADGLSDEFDEFPQDYLRAYSSYYPSQDDWVTLAYEDNWPKVGDYDMNDLVIRERLQTFYNSEGEVSGIRLSGFIDARGASNHNGFALRLMGLPPEIVGDASITIDGNTYGKGAEAYQTDAVIQLWNDSQRFTQTGQNGKCSHFNTVKGCASFAPVPFEFDLDFAYPISNLLHSQLDFFIFRTYDRSREIHFAGYPPTDLFNTARFGTSGDDSAPEAGRYFKSVDNLPWGLKLNSNWQYPREYIDVLWAYPTYETWVESSGADAQDWYLTTERITHVYPQN